VETDQTEQLPAPADAKADSNAARAANSPPRRILEVDVDRFQSALDEADMSDEEKAEYLQIIWSVVLEFVDLGYGIHPINSVIRDDPEQPVQSFAKVAKGSPPRSPKCADGIKKAARPQPKESEKV